MHTGFYCLCLPYSKCRKSSEQLLCTDSVLPGILYPKLNDPPDPQIIGININMPTAFSLD